MVDAVVSLLSFDPTRRPQLRDVYEMLLGLRSAAWGMGEQRWPTDGSVGGDWVSVRAFHGGFGQVPVPKGTAIAVLRDYAASRVCLGEYVPAHRTPALHAWG